MDSQNSGSIQSSSGGDEDYDSITPATAVPPFHHHSTTATTMFDPLSNYFDQNPVWSKSDQNPVHSSTSSFQPFFNHFTSTSSTPAPLFPTLPENTTPRAASDHARSSSSSLGVVRNPKKRSRASRRAPTTVLTTDTTNFRAMVQEFTGIPAPPFTSSPFPRSRFDLFGAPAHTRSNPLFPQRPLSPFSSPSSLLNAITSTTTNTTTTNLNNNNNISDFTLPKHAPNLNMLNSFIQYEPKYPLEPTAQIEPQSHTHLKMDGLDEFGLTHGLPSLVSSDGANRDNHGNLRGIIGNFQEGNKGNENVSSRSEGMLESWICSSD